MKFYFKRTKRIVFNRFTNFKNILQLRYIIAIIAMNF